MPEFAWPRGAKCAVTLCYDDSCPVHYEVVGPALEKNGLRGTFYVTVTSDPLNHPEKWRELAARGHELGNHTLFHPCYRVPPERFGWLDKAYDLGDYTPVRFEHEVRVTNLVLHLLDGKHERTYGNTCCHHTIGRGDEAISMDNILSKLVIGARGPKREIAYPQKGINLMQFGQLSGDGRTFEAIQADIEQIRATGGWGNILFHGVGKGSHGLFIEAAEHDKLTEWLGQQKDVWTAPAVEIARHIRDWQKG